MAILQQDGSRMAVEVVGRRGGGLTSMSLPYARYPKQPKKLNTMARKNIATRTTPGNLCCSYWDKQHKDPGMSQRKAHDGSTSTKLNKNTRRATNYGMQPTPATPSRKENSHAGACSQPTHSPTSLSKSNVMSNATAAAAAAAAVARLCRISVAPRCPACSFVRCLIFDSFSAHVVRLAACRRLLQLLLNIAAAAAGHMFVFATLAPCLAV